MHNITKLFATLIITAGFIFGIYFLGGGCWPCCSFFAWVCINFFIWEPQAKFKINNVQDNDKN